MKLAAPLEKLIQRMSRLPGLGPRSARRIVLHLLTEKDNALMPLIQLLSDAASQLRVCDCGNFDLQFPCSICTDSLRDSSILCVVEHVADLWALERNELFKVHYHVLGGTLSAMDGRGPESLRIDRLLSHVAKSSVKEVILATNATVEGQTTSHYLTEKLKSFPIKITKLAQGVPVGSELDYLDEGTLHAALQRRLAVI
jgi:recombination protein RecR